MKNSKVRKRLCLSFGMAAIMLSLALSVACSKDDPEPDCVQLARRLQEEQLDARNNGASLPDVQNIRLRYESTYPSCKF